MTGTELKTKLALAGVQVTKLAEMLGVSQSNFSQQLTANDIKSGLLERICKVLGTDMSFFYPECGKNEVVNNNTNNIRKQTAHNISNGSGSITENAQPTDDITRMLMEQNAALLKQVSDLMEMLKAKM